MERQQLRGHLARMIPLAVVSLILVGCGGANTTSTLRTVGEAEHTPEEEATRKKHLEAQETLANQAAEEEKRLQPAEEEAQAVKEKVEYEYGK